MEDVQDDFRLSNFGQSSYVNEQGKEQPMFILYRDGFMLLVMSYTGKKALQIKLAYIAAFNAMEAQLAGHPAIDRLSKRGDPERKALASLIGTWVSMAPFGYRDARHQLNAHFGVPGVDAMTVTQVHKACAWVQTKIDAQAVAQKALPE